MATKRARAPSPLPAASLPTEIFRSDEIEDQKSRFIAVFSVSLSAKALQRLPDFHTATHRIAGWRKPSRQRSLFPTSEILYDTGHDDDGEKYGGKRLEYVLDTMKVEGTVVVARWWGGQNIGPIRFTHIENCAKQAIRKYMTAQADAQKEEAVKKQKLDEEASRAALEETLRERDQSIFVLRGLLAEKNAALEGTGPVPVTPSKPVDYTKMTIDQLKRMDKARDASIAFILKQIDKAEEELKKLIDSTEPTQEDEYGTPVEFPEDEPGEETTTEPSTPPAKTAFVSKVRDTA